MGGDRRREEGKNGVGGWKDSLREGRGKTRKDMSTDIADMKGVGAANGKKKSPQIRGRTPTSRS